jgi:hypothetical protein
MDVAAAGAVQVSRGPVYGSLTFQGSLNFLSSSTVQDRRSVPRPPRSTSRIWRRDNTKDVIDALRLNMELRYINIIPQLSHQ